METVIPFDWHRLLIGEHGALFLAEIIVRVLIIWTWTALLLRWIGGRSIAQLSIVEFLLVIALGSAVGDAMFYPEVPLLHAMLVILLVVGFDKGIDLALRRWSRAKSFIDGVPVEVIRDGVLVCDGLKVRRLSALELMELLRVEGVSNLGAVARGYLEPSGYLSLFAADPSRPGLAIVPPVELGQSPAPAAGAPKCCANCGAIAQTADAACAACGGTEWAAVSKAQAFGGRNAG